MLKYYYIDAASKQQCGPFTPNELQRKDIRPETMVWRSGMADWVEAGTLQELNYLFDSRIPVPQEQKEPERRPQTQPQQQSQPQQQPQSSPQAQTYNNRQQQTPYSRNRQQEYQYNYDEQRKWAGVIPMPKNWLVESILLTIFCCSPISLVGIFYAAKVETLYKNKDYEGAQDASQKAKLWTLWGIAFLPVIYIILIFIGMLV